MNSLNRDQYISFAVGARGGSAKQLDHSQRSGRGLHEEQKDPLVLWWVRLLKEEYSADGSKHQSYRRSRWGQRAARKDSPVSPYWAMHKEGRLLTYSLCAVLIGLTASLNMVARAETAKAVNLTRSVPANAREIPSAERFSKMKDFVGKHNQYLDLSNLNEFKWSDEGPVTAAAHTAKPRYNGTFDLPTGDLAVQPQAVNQKKSTGATKSESMLREDSQYAAADKGQSELGAWLETTK